MRKPAPGEKGQVVRFGVNVVQRRPGPGPTEGAVHTPGTPSYNVSVELPSQDHRKLYCRARDERRRISSYVTKVVLEGDITDDLRLLGAGPK